MAPWFVQGLVILAEACGAAVSDSIYRTYWLLLQDLPQDAFEQAVHRCARERDQRFLPADPTLRLPTVAELRSYAVLPEIEAGLRAWTQLQRAAAESGAWRALDAEAAVVAAVEEVFGSWPAFCALIDVAQAAKKAEFLAAYKSARRGGAEGQGRLVGLLGTDSTGDAIATLPGEQRRTPRRLGS